MSETSSRMLESQETVQAPDAPAQAPPRRSALPWLRAAGLARALRPESAASPPAGVGPELELESGPSAEVLRRDSQRRRLLAAADVVALLLAYSGVWLLDQPPGNLVDRLPLLIVLLLWIVMHKLHGLYDRDAHLINKSTLDELPRLLQSVVIGSALVFMFGPLLPGIQTRLPQTVMFALEAAVLIPALRIAIRALLLRNQRPERLVFVGGGAVTRLLRRRLSSHPEYGVEVLGYIDELSERAAIAADVVPVLGTIEEFESIALHLRVERAVIAFGEMTHEHLIEVIRAARRLGIRISVVPRLFEAIGHAVELDDIEGMTLLGLRSLQRTRSSLALKRVIDIVLSATALIMVSPLLLIIALGIKLSSRGSVLFSHARVGRGGHDFRMIKFRTMYEGADGLKRGLAHLNEAEGPMFKIADDPRVTPFGRLLRRTSLDELPQLYNVLRGQMSLVGPRPLIPSESAHVLGRHRDRLRITPGLTGPWQVLGRTAIPFEDMVRLDFLYVAEWSLWSDIKLMLRTAPLVVFGRGV